MKGRLWIVIVTSAFAQESGPSEVLQSTILNVVARISQSEDPDLLDLHLQYKARILNSSKRSVFLPTDSEASSSVLWEVKASDGAWRELHSSGLPVYTLEQRFGKCEALSPGRTRDISFSNDQISMFKAQAKNLGSAALLRLTILLPCRSKDRTNARPFEGISNTITRTEPFIVQIQSMP